MFEAEKRYMTRGVADTIEPALQLILWNMIDELDGEKGYLQVFDIKGTKDDCIIEHSQEEPEYRKQYEYVGINVAEREAVKIFVIEDGEYSTMMYAEEY